MRKQYTLFAGVNGAGKTIIRINGGAYDCSII